jgi:hypothetical protein
VHQIGDPRPDYTRDKYCAKCRLVYPLEVLRCIGYPSLQINGCGHMLRTVAKGKAGVKKKHEGVFRY